MNIHEYQAKQLFQKFGIRTPRGIPAFTVDEAVAAAEQLGGTLWVVGIVTVGYFFGNLPWVKQHLDKIIWALIFVPGLLVLLGSWRARRKAVSADA